MVPETIKALSKKYPPYIVSNCGMDISKRFLRIPDWAGILKILHVQFIQAGYENIRIIMERNGLDEAVYVGDTQGDANACKEEVLMIFASYGLGEVEGEYPSIRTFTELQNIGF